MALKDAKDEVERLRRARAEYIRYLHNQHSNWSYQDIVNAVKADLRFGECNKMDVKRALEHRNQ